MSKEDYLYNIFICYMIIYSLIYKYLYGCKSSSIIINNSITKTIDVVRI